MMDSVETVANEAKMDAKKDGPIHSCPNFDVELGHEIAQILLVGLATACVDNTTGDFFRTPASNMVGFRNEMVDFLQQQSESFVAESVIQDESDENSDPFHPTEIINNMLDAFSATKRNLWGRVSNWLLTEMREDKIDDFVQEMGRRGFWPNDRREPVAETLLKNVDFRNMFHCGMKFDSEEELEDHKNVCTFRVLNCGNEGCRATFCAVYLEKHDADCQLKVLDCEQGCSERILRREMDRHCITVCPMKTVKCPFYQVGCQTGIPRCTTQQHCSEFLNAHLLCVLQSIHKEEASEEDLKEHANLLERSLSPSQKAETMDVRSLTVVIKALENEVGGVKRSEAVSTGAAAAAAQVTDLEAPVENEVGGSGDASSEAVNTVSQGTDLEARLEPLHEEIEE